ncbi:MerR family transcriptional regulator [Micromonospora sp. NPDC000442]|uniref:MerR family transcriptional regulator n=1 Tax=Micromonospora sp. NPDC000442 TaxID=3364217 RepID=UPI00369E6DF1
MTGTVRKQREGPDEVLTIQEMARRSGFTEPTLRYYERIGLLGRVARDPDSGHRRYDGVTVDRIEALACLRSSGMTVTDMRRYLELLDLDDDQGAQRQRELFAQHAERLDAEMARLRTRREYIRAKADMWDARARRDADAEFHAVRRVERARGELLPGRSPQ